VNAPGRVLDVVTLGEAMIRLSAPLGESLESAQHLDVRAAGAEANVSVTLARMGFRAGWISRLVDDPLGRRIAGEMRRHGVDVSAIAWTTTGRTGLYFLEPAAAPRGVALFYDRADSAASQITPADIDWAYVRAARWAHVTGITVALGDACAATVVRFLDECRTHGVKTSFDVNHRRKLWTAARACAILEPIVQGVDLLIASHDDAAEVFALRGSAEARASEMRGRFGASAAVITAGEAGAYLADADGVRHEAAVPGLEVDRIGRGDALAAGLLWGALEGDLRAGLRYGVALATLAGTYHGDVAWSTRQDVLALLAGRDSKPVR
jgi:2-dehydro-3-deoxygluconokinase